MKSEMGKSAYWRMQYESAIGALADLIAEHTETAARIDAALALHEVAPRGYRPWSTCSTCSVTWPCATVRALRGTP